EACRRSGAVPQRAKEPAEALLDLIDQEGQAHQQGQHCRQVLLPVPVVRLEVIALVLSGIEGLLLDLPAAPPGAHHALDAARLQREIGDPSPALDLAIWEGLF